MAEPEQRRVAVVTGGGQGLGRETALAFSRAGHDVVIIGRTASKLEAVAAQMAGRCLPLVADLTDPDQVRAAFGRIGDTFGGIDVLVNNAASYRPFPFDTATDKDVIDMVSLSLLAPIWCTREALPLIRQRRLGDIVNISTQSVDFPQPLMIVYAAAKAALETLSRGLRYELVDEPIRVMVFQLGVVAGTQPEPDWLALQDRYVDGVTRAGIDRMFVFPGAEPSSIAASIVHAVTAPRDIYLETVVVRGTSDKQR